MFRSQIFRDILSQEVIAARATDPTIQMVVQQEVHSEHTGKFETIDLLALVPFVEVLASFPY